jgi:hypothetical protein
MSINIKKIVAPVLLSVFLITGCNSVNSNKATGKDATGAAKQAETSAKPNDDGTITSGTGVEKEKPNAGKGNLQGRVLYNERPAEGIEVKLCEKYSQYLDGCSGETFTAKTDAQGEYLIKNITPRIYEGLVVKVFNTNYYVFATSGIISAAKYNIEEGKTFFASDTNLFKQDLKLVSPRAGSKIDANDIEVKWDAYPEAAYYKFSLYADNSTGAATEYDYINKRVDGLSYVLDKPLLVGTYRCQVEAFNANGTKLSESSDDIKFTVTAGRASGAETGGK